MSIYDYHIVMIQVNISDLKARLSFYIGRVKEGHEIIVMDRKTSVAKMEPFQGESPYEAILTPASKSPARLRSLKIKPVERNIDALGLLREERDRR
jgi:antitoxin (DNA-binding transcriptional repressor) of toxin-antitoxin stability system